MRLCPRRALPSLVSIFLTVTCWSLLVRFLELRLSQVRRHAHPVGIGHVSCFQHLWFQALWILEKRVSGQLVGAGEIEGDDVCGSVTGGTFVISSDINGLLDVSSGSCIEVCKSAAVVKPDDCHGSSCNVASTVGDGGEVNYEKGSVVVRRSPHSMVSHVVQYGSEEYAVCGTRALKPDDTLLGNGIENGMTVHVLRRLRGGASASANVDIPEQWQCSVCNAIGCWPTRKRCYRCDAPREYSNPDSTVRGPLGRAPLALCLRRGVQGQGHGLFHHGTWRMGLEGDFGAGFESSPENHDARRLCKVPGHDRSQAKAEQENEGTGVG